MHFFQENQGNYRMHFFLDILPVQFRVSMIRIDCLALSIIFRHYTKQISPFSSLAHKTVYLYLMYQKCHTVKKGEKRRNLIIHKVCFCISGVTRSRHCSQMLLCLNKYSHTLTTAFVQFMRMLKVSSAEAEQNLVSMTYKYTHN